MKKNRSFILFSTLIFIAIFVIEHINQRFWLYDFKVYYSAAEALINSHPVYGQPFGLSTGFYKYSPFTLLCFTATTLFSYEIACSIHFIVLALSTLMSLMLLDKILNQYPFLKNSNKLNWILSLSFVCILNHLVRELHLGNVNVLIVLLLCSCIYFNKLTKHWLAGATFAMALLIKPYLIILGLPLLLYKKYKTILSAIVTSIVAVLIVTLFLGFNQSYQLHIDWLKAMLDHSSYLQSSHTIISILNNLGFSFMQQTWQLYLLAGFLMLYVAVFFIMIKPKQNSKNEEINFINTSFIFLAILPNFLITDTEHFLYALPVIFILLNFIFSLKNKMITIFFILFVVMYGANSSDIFGNALYDSFEKWGLLGLGNLGLIILLVYILSNNKKLKAQAINIELS